MESERECLKWEVHSRCRSAWEKSVLHTCVCKWDREHWIKWIYFSIAMLPFIMDWINPFLLVGSRGKNDAVEISGSLPPWRKGRIHIRELHELTFSTGVFFLVFVCVYEYLLCSIKDQGISYIDSSLKEEKSKKINFFPYCDRSKYSMVWKVWSWGNGIQIVPQV